jgi:hypothetical protein
MLPEVEEGGITLMTLAILLEEALVVSEEAVEEVPTAMVTKVLGG